MEKVFNTLEFLTYRVRFPAHLEKLYSNYYFNRSLFVIRIALILGFLLYASFGFLDLYMAPVSYKKIWFIRFVIVCPLFALIFVLTFMKFFVSIVGWAMALMTLVAGYGIIAMLAIAQEPETELLYYAGVILVVMWGCTLVRLRFYYALVVCLVILAGYEYTAVGHLLMLQNSRTTTVFINNNFFIAGSMIIGIISAYLIDRSMRLNFLNQLMLQDKQKDLETERNELKIRDEKSRDELMMAQEIQQQLIPEKDPFENIASLYIPMDLVGGDFYDYIHFRDDSRWGIFISDVSGHGVSSSLITAMMKSIILQAGEKRKKPAELVAGLNDMLMDMTAEKFVTGFYCVYDPAKRNLVYTNAGHHPPLLIRDGRVMHVPYERYLPMGVYNINDLTKMNKEYTSQSFQLDVGDQLFFYTDGIPEIRMNSGTGGGEFFSTIMEEVLLSIPDVNCREFIDRFYREIVHYNGSDSFYDDICLIYLKVL